jgi:TetR/AcrR family transcriptional regulator, regulator of mycofactocin system
MGCDGSCVGTHIRQSCHIVGILDHVSVVAASDAGRRERKKRETRQALEDAAWRLFTRKGYDATTLADITNAVDVAPRTFFRYFDSKEAVLFGDWRTDVDELARRVSERPIAETPLEALAEAILSFSARFEADRAVIFQRMRIAAQSTHVGRYQRQIIEAAWEDTLAAAIAARLDVDLDTDLHPRLYARVAVAVLLAALGTWVARNDRTTDLSELVRSGFDVLAGATSAHG